MRIFLFVLSFYGVLVFYGGFVAAQDKPVLGLATPNVNWVVKPMVPKNGFPSLSCVMEASFSNNYTLSFKGKNGRLIALRIKKSSIGSDTNKMQSFVGLGLGKNSYALQSHVSGNQIDASLLTAGDVAKRMRDLSVMRLKLGTDDHYFSLLGFNHAFQKMLVCNGRGQVKTMKVVDSTRQIPNTPNQVPNVTIADPAIMPSEPIDIVQKSELTVPTLTPVIMDADPFSGQQMDVGVEVELVTPKQSGKDVPLAMALPIIVPSDYKFKLENGVDATTQISWSRDLLWHDSLRQALADNGYTLFIKDREIRIAPKGSPRQLPRDTAPISLIADSVVEYKPTVPMPISVPDINETSIAPQPQPVNNGPEWAAKNGQKLSEVLKKWAKVKNIKTHIVLDDDPRLSSDFKMKGSFEMAVDLLLKQNLASGATPTTALLKNDKGRVTHVSGYQSDAFNLNNTMSGNKTTVRWRALEGTDLRKNLKRWSAKQHIDFVWNGGQVFLLHKSVKTTASYAEAVSLLLSQFKGQDIRPVAMLNNDPETGKTTLIVNVSKKQ